MSFSFGTPSSAPANTSLSSGFNFGGNKPATPGFGLATSQPSTGLFGSTPATSAPAFGTATPFGATSTPGFGASATPGFGATAAPAFGASSTAPAFGTATPAFGATSAAPAFGATSTAPTFGTPSFGAASAAPTFGSTTTPAFGATNTGGAFGQTGLGGLNFGTGSNTSTAASTAPTSTTGGLGGLGGLSFPAATTQSALAFSGLATSTSGGLFDSGGPLVILPLFSDMFPCQPPGSPSIPITQTFQMISPSYSPSPRADLSGLFDPSCVTTLRYDLLGPKRDYYPTITPSCGPKLGATTVTSALPVSSVSIGPGLGGIAPTGTSASNTTPGDGKVEPPKQTKLPNELSTTVDSFKDFVKKQKSLSSEVMRLSIKPLHKVSQSAESLVRAALALRGEVGRARAHSRRLRAAAAAATAAAEAHADPGAELESSPPPAYVKELVAELEQQLATFRRQMELADRQMQAEPRLLTEQEVTLGMRRMHEALVALAARLQAAHARVLAQQEQYRNLRKYVLKDSSDVFHRHTADSSLDKILQDAEGRKRSKLTAGGAAVLADPKAALGNIQQLAGPTPFTYIGNTISSFPGSDATGPRWQAPAPEPLQLQRPPGKRGKQ